MTALRIENHRLVADPGHPFELVDKCDEVAARRKALGTVARTITPRLLVIHYAVTDSLDATYRAQHLRGFFAHLSIDGYRDGERSRFRVIQQVPFNVRGSHAGESEWRGLKGCNDFSIGIEIANPGPLVVGDDQKLRTVYRKVWDPNDAEAIPTPAGYPKAWTHWAKYSDEERAICAAVALALRDAGYVQEIVGHSDIAPGRKFDPGPAFPMRWLQDLVFPPEPDTIPAPPPEVA